jgi:hypothetical protein
MYLVSSAFSCRQTYFLTCNTVSAVLVEVYDESIKKYTLAAINTR